MEAGLRGNNEEERIPDLTSTDLVSSLHLARGSDRSYWISSTSFSSSLKYLPRRVTLRIKWGNEWKILCKQEPTWQCYFFIQLTTCFFFLMDTFISWNQWGREEMMKITFSKITWSHRWSQISPAFARFSHQAIQCIQWLVWDIHVRVFSSQEHFHMHRCTKTLWYRPRGRMSSHFIHKKNDAQRGLQNAPVSS